MDQLRVCGLDLSLTSTGVSTACGGLLADPPRFEAIRPPAKLKGCARLDWMTRAVVKYLADADPDVIILEGPSYGSTGAYWHENAGLHWLVKMRIWKADRRYAVITPSTLKKYATGVGRGKKSVMVGAACHRFGIPPMGEDEADALWLAAAGCQKYGWPVVKLPAVNVAALDVVEWPALNLQDPEPAAVAL
jgi:crossover junction endodeoxyribonuclease RuvC